MSGVFSCLGLFRSKNYGFYSRLLNFIFLYEIRIYGILKAIKLLEYKIIMASFPWKRLFDKNKAVNQQKNSDSVKENKHFSI